MSYTDPQIGTLTISGDPARFVATERVPVSGVSMDFEPVQDLHGYEYPWPADGGSNVWDEVLENGNINTTTGGDTGESGWLRTKNFIPVSPGTQYYYLAPSKIQFGRFYYYDAEKNFVSYTGTSSVLNHAFTVPADVHYLRFVLQKQYYGNTYNHDISVNYPATVTSYTPYSNICPITGRDSVTVYVSPEPSVVDGTEEHEIEFGHTVYAGQLTINEDGSGQIVSKYANVDLGTLTWSKNATYNELFNSSNLPISASRVTSVRHLCSIYKSVNSSQVVTEDKSVAISANGVLVYVHDSAYADAQTFSAAMQGVALVYELAEPVTLQLDPIEITTLIGLNYVWTSDNNLITITFPYMKEVQPMALSYDHCWTYPKAYIDKLEARIAALETAASEAKTAAAPEVTKETVAEEITVTEEPETEAPVTKKGGK